MLKQLSTLVIAALAALSASAQSVETVNYTASTAVFCNPERGIFTHQEFHSGDNYELTDQFVSRCRQQGISIMFCGFVMEDYRNCMIPTSYLQRIRQNLATLRRGGMKAVVRFSYSFSESDKPWDCPWALTKTHIAQLTALLRENSDVICLLEAGFVGVWGEWYYTENHNFEPRTIEDYQPRRNVLDALLSAIPTDRFIAVRYPDAKLKTFNITYADTITAATAFNGSDLSRIGFHNDGFLATSDDYGTFQNKQDARKFWMQETRYAPMGGETAKLSSYCSIDNAAKQMANYHWSYINKDYHLDVIKKWKDEGLYETMERRIGYRISLTTGHYDAKGTAGNPYATTLIFRNNGWAAPYNPHPMQLVLRNKQDHRIQYTMPIKKDIRTFQPGTSTTIPLRMVLPYNMPEGDYELCLRISDPTPSLAWRPEYCIRLSNDDLWEEATGLNVLHTVHVAASTATTNSPAGILLSPTASARNVWAGYQTSVVLSPSLFAQSQVGDTLQYVLAGAGSTTSNANDTDERPASSYQHIEQIVLDTALLGTLQRSGMLATAADGSNILAIQLVEPDHTLTPSAILTPLTSYLPHSATYDLSGRAAPHPAGNILITNGRKTLATK